MLFHLLIFLLFIFQVALVLYLYWVFLNTGTVFYRLLLCDVVWPQVRSHQKYIMADFFLIFILPKYIRYRTSEDFCSGIDTYACVEIQCDLWLIPSIKQVNTGAIY